MEQDPFEEYSDAFMGWLQETPKTRVSSKIALQDFRSRGAGRGAVAIADIAEDEELFAVPRTLVLSVQNSDLHSRLSTTLKDLGPWLSLMLVMLYEYLKGKESQWYPYFLVLPRQFDSLMFWSDAELAELQESAVVNKIGKTEAEDSILRDIVPIVQGNPSLFPPPSRSTEALSPESQKTVLELAHMMGSLIMAYAFDVEEDADDGEGADSQADSLATDDEDDPPKGMVPLADMLNADADLNNARLFYDNDLLIMKAIKPIKSGEEIFNDYGPLPRSDLLRRYGYISSRYSQYDVVEFSLQSICDAAGVADPGSTLGYLEDLGLLDDGYAINRIPVDSTLAEAIPDQMKMVISTLISSESQEEKKKPPKPRLSLAEGKVLQRLVLRRQATYATTLDEDKATRERFRQGNGPQEHISRNRLRIATEVRLGEKEILQKLSDLISVFITDNEQSNKRPRANRMDTNTKKQRVR